MKIEELKPLEKNPFKSKGDKQIQAIAKSITDFEEMMKLRKIVIDENNEILGGNKRYYALKSLGYKEIPNDWVEKALNLTEDQKREFIVKDNAHWGSEWDFDMLNDWNIDLADFGIEFEDMEIETEEKELKEVEPDNVDEVKTDIQEGDLFQIGNHFLYCSDSVNQFVYDKFGIIEKDKTICFTSPPYNVGHNLGYKNNSKYIHPDKRSDYFIFLQKYLDNILKVCKYSFTNLQFLANNKIDIINFLHENKNNFVDIAFWKKLQVAPSIAENVMNSQVECIFIHSNETNNRSIKTANFRGDVSNIIETNSASSEKNKEKTHNATFPVKFAEHFISNFSQDNYNIIDPFAGIGTVMVVCEQLQRINYSVEIEPVYCQVIINRMIKLNPNIEVKCLNRIFNPLDVNGF
jgi:DNA modification methylase